MSDSNHNDGTIRIPVALFEALIAGRRDLPAVTPAPAPAPSVPPPSSAVVEVLKEHGPLSLTDLSKALKLKRDVAWQEVQRLREAGAVERTGTRRGSRYKLHG